MVVQKYFALALFTINLLVTIMASKISSAILFNVVIRDCILQSGDDCVAGFDCNNVLIENCEMNSSCNAPTITLVSNCDNVVYIDSTKLREVRGEIQDVS